ncbi:MAG: hypothetical protein FJZ87_07830 [Chloroflexi bacterium]|nr:hypothetical protein [Chloroflexota bacterium]
MTWRLSLDPYGNGVIGSDDCDGGGVKLTGLRDVRELVECIDVLIREGGRRNFIREDGALVEVYASQSRPGKYVIERQDGAWARLSREDLRDLRNELLRRVSGQQGQYQGEVERLQPPDREDGVNNFTRKMSQLNQMNNELTEGTLKRLEGYADLLAKLRGGRK